MYILSGPDGNVVVQLGPDGAIVVDAQRAALGQALVAELKKITGPTTPTRVFFNTNGDPGHAGSNENVRDAGQQVFGGNMAAQASDLAESAVHMAHENVLNRLSAPGARAAYEFNLELMAGRTDLDLGLTPDVPGTPGLLPLDIARVEQVVGYLNTDATTSLALRVLTGDPASVPRA